MAGDGEPSVRVTLRNSGGIKVWRFEICLGIHPEGDDAGDIAGIVAGQLILS